MSTYYLKYYAEIQNFRGQLTRVEIHQRDTAPDSVLQIGDVCGLAMEIQGGTEDIFTPIIKTQARLSMISSDDKPTAGGIKYGDWGELYTPDATLYKFVIKTKANASALIWEPRWSGYITPDSWQEGLEYRSAITITARDNIGHLQDFEFDMAGDSYGLAKIKDILDAAMARIDMPMQVSYNYGVDIRADGTRLLDSYIAVSKFSTQSWYQVVESILDSIGYTLRYTDKNRVSFAPMRHLPLCGESSEEEQPEMSVLEFYGGNAKQVPAVKSITETHEYDYSDDVFRPILGNITYGQNQTYRCAVEGNKMPSGGRYRRPEHDAIYNAVTGAGGTVWDAGSDLLNIAGIDQVRHMDGSGDFDSEGGRWNQYAFLAANGVEGSVRSQAMSFFCGATDITIKASFAKNPAGLYKINGVTKASRLDDSLYKIRYRVWFENGDTVRHWTGYGWQNVAHTIEKEYDSQNEYATDLEIALQPSSDLPEGGVLHIEFLGITYKMFYNSLACDGVYARLASVSVTPNVTNLSKNTVKTINDEKYNVRMERQTEISPLSREAVVAEPENYSSALFYYPTGSAYPKAFPYMGNWDNLNTTTVKPIPVLVHQQILCYRGANLWQLSGECAPSGNGSFWFNSLCVYKGRSYILQSGTIDFMTGTIDGTILREFLDYEDLWDDTEEGDWQDSTEYPGSGAASTSSSSGSSLAPGGSGNFFEEDGQGGIQLKEEYAGLRTKGYLIGASDGGPGGGGGGGLIERLWRVGDLSDDVTDFDNTANDTFNAYTINSLHTRIKALEQNPGGVSSVAGLTGDVSASDLFTALGLGTAATRAVGAIENANTGLVTGGDVYSFVNSSVATATATFRGTNTTATTEASFLAWADGLTHDLNDYVFWATTDAYGNTVYKRYKYDGTQWVFEYNLNNSSFTASQWGAINSGITSQKITSYDTVAAYFTNGVLGTANIPQLPTSKITDLDTTLTSISASITALEKMFIDDTYTVDGQTKHRLKVNSTYFEGLITTGFLIGAADGGPGGGGGGGIDLNLMWASLQNTTPDTHATDKFHKNHLPAIVQSDGISAGYTLDSGNLATHLNIGISAIDMSKVSGLSTALAGKADASALANYVTLDTSQTIYGTKTFLYGFYVSEDTSWSNVYRYIPFGSGTLPKRIQFIHDSFMYNPSTGKLRTGGYVVTNGTSSQFLKADGSLDNTSYAIQNADNSLIAHGNEFNFLPSGYAYNRQILINYRTQGDDATSITSYLFLKGDKTRECANITAAGFSIPGGSSSGFLKANGTVDSTAYLPLTAGSTKALTSSLYTPGVIISETYNSRVFQIITTGSGKNVDIGWNYSSGAGAGLGLRSSDDTNSGEFYLYARNSTSTDHILNGKPNGTLLWDTYTVLHSNNYSNYALPLSGGTLENSTANFLSLNATSGEHCYQYFKVSGTNKASIGYFAGLAYIANEATTARIGVNDSGIPQYWSSFNSYTAKTLWHAGNSNLTTVPWSASSLTLAGAISGATNISATGTANFSYYYLEPGSSTAACLFITNTYADADYVHIFCSNSDKGRTTRPLVFQYGYGNVGIGVAQPSYKLDVAGVIHSTTGVISPGYGNFAASYSSSDQRLKDDIETIKPEYAIEKLMALRPSEWVWNEKSSMAGRKGAGLVAQHVEPVLPWNIEKNGEYLSLCYDMFHPYEIGSIQFLKGETDMLKDEVAELRNRVETLESENKRLKERIYA